LEQGQLSSRFSRVAPGKWKEPVFKGMEKVWE